MNSKNQSSIRVFGQRTIDSTFRNLPPRNSSEENVRNQASRKSETAHPSLSHFLDPKPQTSPHHLPQTVPGKSTPFLSPFGLRVSRGEEGGTVKEVVKEKNGGSGCDDKVVFQSFKHTEDKGDFFSEIDVNELENPVADDVQESRKRKAPYEGGNENQTARKHVVVLGGDSKLKPKRQVGNDSSNKRPRPLYNHYANGRGWWDHEMEGVDNEELGFNEVWEGVGSTTLGGIIDWH